MKALGEYDTLTSNGLILATWKTSKPPVLFDSKAFQETNPELYHQYLKTGEVGRRFLLKEQQ
ncbi:MAG: hypothetical protein ACRERS_08735, partial [Methylococcales bacterium]